MGLLLGSFLNVCTVRVPLGESVVKPGSRCMACGHAVRWFDNIPVLSWLVLRGRCRDCGATISWHYPAVELATGAWGLLTSGLIWGVWGGLRTGPNIVNSLPVHNTAEATAFGVLGLFVIPLIVIDWEWQRLPDSFTLTGVVIGIFLVCLQAIFLGPKDDQIVLNSAKQLRLSSPGSFAAQGNVFLTGPEALIFGRLAAVCGAALILLLFRWGYKAVRKREGLGLGDVKLLAMVAAFLGFWPALLTLFLGVMLAAAYAVVLLLRRKADAMTKLSLGSFLGVGGLLAALFGDGIIAWYSGFLR